MLGAIFSNQSLEMVLFFVLLNGKCYATQLSKKFKVPLTPIQCALAKLEKEKILVSHYVGKTRVYEFNADFPLLAEFEALLKKAYVHLPIEKKKLYYSPSFPVKARKAARMPMGPGGGQRVIASVWEKLLDVKTLCFSAKSKSPAAAGGWNGIGKGSVEVRAVNHEEVHFVEKGQWSAEDGKAFDFSNVFRWTLQMDRGAIVLEHLRFGLQHPVLLFSLVPTDAHTLESLESHACKQDDYFGQLRYDRHYLQLNWRVIGPKKNEEIDYLYT